MEVGFLSILALGCVLGIKHAIEPDHVIAVSTIASQSKKLYRSTLAGVFWGIGHTATLFIIGIILILMKGEIPEKTAMSLEFLVGIMLVYLGVNTTLSLNHQTDPNSHDKPNHGMSYFKSMLIGFVHGLAGSGAMVLLTISTVKSAWEASLFMLIFGVGTVIGMLIFTTIIGLPFVMTAKKINLNTTLTKLTGSISVLFGLYYMYNLGITEGLFQLWLR
jgi:high-affinity nickel permease